MLKPFICAAAVTALFALPALAQGPQHHSHCQEVIITASGTASMLGEGRARRLAINNWQREVRAKFGERYMDFTRARLPQFECGSSSIGVLGSLSKRCSVAGYPCAPNIVADATGPAPEEPVVAMGSAGAGKADDEFASMLHIQRWLALLNFLAEDDIDGTYGPKTRRAILRFQASANLRPTGEADEATIQVMRARVRVVRR